MTSTETLATTIGSIELQNPILTASGTFGSGKEYAPFVEIGRLGGVVTKSVTLNPTRGNPPPRVVETPGGMLNAIGLQNEGVDVFLRDLLPPLREKAARVVVNVAGKTEDDYLECARRLSRSEIDALEINISCPNVKQGGITFGTCPEVAADLVGKLKAATDRPLWIKLSPNVTDVCAVAKACEAAGADALTVSNTFLGMAIDIEKRRPILGNVTGGLSGPCVHPLVLRLVWQVRQAVECPLIAVGGVRSVREVVAYLMAGASAVQVGTMNFVEPGITARLLGDLTTWLEEHQTTVREVIGTLRTA